MLVECKVCGKEFKAKPSEVARGTKYCSRDCLTEALTKKETVQCHVCGKELKRAQSEVRKSKTGTFFCNGPCRNKWDKRNLMPKGSGHPNWKGGEGSYRARAMAVYEHKCSNQDCPIIKAGITVPDKMLDVDHIDNNRLNNEVENLQILCVWCHAQKTRAKWRKDCPSSSLEGSTNSLAQVCSNSS